MSANETTTEGDGIRANPPATSWLAMFFSLSQQSRFNSKTIEANSGPQIPSRSGELEGVPNVTTPRKADPS